MLFAPGCTISAVRFLRKMAGRSQASLFEASDGRQYVVKWMCGPNSTTSVRREALRNTIYQAIGLPVSSWTPIEIPDDLIAAYREMWIETAERLVRPQAGVHFASRLAGSPSGKCLEILPSDMFSRVSNRGDFWGAYAADIWTERFESRQAVFVPGDGHNEWKAVFIDHGCAPAGLNGGQEPQLTACLYPDRPIYPELDMIREIQGWIDQIHRLGHSAVATALQSLPSDWVSASVESMASHLVERIPRLREVIFPPLEPSPIPTRADPRRPFALHLVLRAGQVL